jgi:type VI protein secretion system component VasK
MSWPGQGGAPLTRLEAQIKGGISKVEGAGFWGLYRLIEQGNVMRSGRLVVVKLLFNDRVTSAEIRLNPQDGAGNPLFGRVRALPEPGQAPEVGLMDIFREQRLSPPRQLFTNGMTCKPLNLAAAPAVPTVPPAP